MEELQQQKEETKRSQITTYVLIGLVVGLLIFSAAQTFQINSLEGQFITQRITGGVTQAPAAAPRGAPAAPAMVGGC